MTRLGAKEYRNGRVWNGFDYALQAWVLEEFIQPCGYPKTMRAAKVTLCRDSHSPRRPSPCS